MLHLHLSSVENNMIAYYERNLIYFQEEQKFYERSKNENLNTFQNYLIPILIYLLISIIMIGYPETI